MDTDVANLYAREGALPAGTGRPAVETAGVTLSSVLSPDYVSPADYSWYVMRVPYGKELEVASALQEQHPEVLPYVAMHVAARVENGHRKLVEESAVPNLLFLYGRERDVLAIQSQPVALPKHPTWQPAELRFMYDHTRKTAVGTDHKMTVPFAAMASFIRVTMLHDEHVRVFLAEQFTAEKGDEVVVTEGKFAGVRGRVARLHGQTCVLVDLQGICIASTAYVPKAFLRKV